MLALGFLRFSVKEPLSDDDDQNQHDFKAKKHDAEVSGVVTVDPDGVHGFQPEAEGLPVFPDGIGFETDDEVEGVGGKGEKGGPFDEEKGNAADSFDGAAGVGVGVISVGVEFFGEGDRFADGGFLGFGIEGDENPEAF